MRSRRCKRRRRDGVCSLSCIFTLSLFPSLPFSFMLNPVHHSKPTFCNKQLYSVTHPHIDSVNSTDGDILVTPSSSKILYNKRRLSPEQIQKIKSYTDIITVIESFQLPQFTRYSDGSRATALCPFHDDTHPSLSIDKSRGIFKCFACGAGGDLFQFIRQYDYQIRQSQQGNSNPEIVVPIMTYPQSIQYVVQNFLPLDKISTFEPYLSSSTTNSSALALGILNFTLLKQQPSTSTSQFYNYNSRHVSSKERIYLANLATADYYGKLLVTLPMAGRARSHLRNRNIHPSTVRSFALGYAPDCYSHFYAFTQTPRGTITTTSPLSLVHHLYTLGFTPNEMMDAGLAVLTSLAKKRIQGQIQQWQVALAEEKEKRNSTDWIHSSDNNTTTRHHLPQTIDISNSTNLNQIQFNINDIMDRFRSRLMVPIFDSNGTHIVGFGGRYLGDEQQKDTAEDDHDNNKGEKDGNGKDSIISENTRGGKFKNAKYINSPESVVFSKKNSLFGLHAAISSLSWEKKSALNDFSSSDGSFIKEPPSFVVVEGYFDVIALHDAGIQEAVGSMGTALSMEQLSLLSTILQERNMSGKPSKLVICLDNDSAGDRAVARLCVGNIFYNLVQTYPVAIFVATLPKGIKDPSDFIESKKNLGGHQIGESFRKEVLDSAMPWERWYIAHLVDSAITNDPVSASAACNKVAKLISVIQDTEEQIHYTRVSIDLILARQSIINTTLSVRSTLESKISEILSKIIGDSADKYQTNSPKRKGLLKQMFSPSSSGSKSPLVLPAPISPKSKRQLKIKKSKDPLIDHFSGFKFNPLDATWLGIDEAEWKRKGNLVLGKIPSSEYSAKTSSGWAGSKRVVYFNSDEYLGKKFLTKDAIIAGYNPTIRRPDAGNMHFGTASLLEHDSNFMLNAAERNLLKLLTLSPKARLSMKTLVDGGKHGFMEWSCLEREWLFQCLTDAPGRQPLPVNLQNNGTRGQLRKYLAQLRDCPSGAFIETHENDPTDESVETSSIASNSLDASRIVAPYSLPSKSMIYEAHSLLHNEDESDVFSLHPSSKSAGSLEYFFDDEVNDAEVQLILEHSNDDTYIDFMIQVAVSNVLDAQASQCMKTLVKKWIETSSLPLNDRTAEYQSTNNTAESIHLTNDRMFIRSRVNMMMRTKLNISESSKKLTAKLLSSLKSDDGEGVLSLKKQQDLVKMVDDFVNSLPEDTHRPESFDDNYIFGLDDYDAKVDSRFSGKPTKIDWETVNLDFDSILE